MAAPEGRSLSAAVSIPQWMKEKMNKFDFEQGAFSPTEIDDSYLLYYRLPKEHATEESKTNSNITNQKKTIQIDASKYTLHCQKYLKDGNECATAQRVVYPIVAKTKSSGVDDGFKGEAAKCGSSIISLANMIVSGKVTRGFDVESKNQTEEEPMVPPPASLMMRRGSRSLPASPLSSPHNSPKSQRKVNKYFTGPFVESDKHQGSWILSNLLARRENLSQSCDMIAEEESEDARLPSPKAIRKMEAKKKPGLIPKASELREMNFWSPTSM